GFLMPNSRQVGCHARKGVRQANEVPMTAPLKTIENTGDLAVTMRDLGRRARAAAHALALAPAEQKDRALRAMARAVTAQTDKLLAANAEDIAEAKAGGVTGAFIDRLMLNDKRVAAVAEALEVVAALKDPVGTVMESWTRPNGMVIERVRVPLGVV